MVAFTVLFPPAKAIHWLRAASGSALLVSIGIWTAITVVSRVSADGVGPAPPVLVVSAVMEARAVSSPVANTVNGLRATLLDALRLPINKRAGLPTKLSLGGDLVGSAPYVRVGSREQRPSVLKHIWKTKIDWQQTIILKLVNKLRILQLLKELRLVNVELLLQIMQLVRVNSGQVKIRKNWSLAFVVAAAVNSPLSLAINGLTATTLGALLQLVLVWASKAIVQGNLAHTVHTAALILVVLVVIGASIVGTPRSNTVHRLSTTIVGALLEVVGVWASMSVTICMKGDLVEPAFPVAVRILIMATESILIPSANTVHRLGAA